MVKEGEYGTNTLIHVCKWKNLLKLFQEWEGDEGEWCWG
jgi:hypothetical protein